jgi:hypothetical protein
VNVEGRERRLGGGWDWVEKLTGRGGEQETTGTETASTGSGTRSNKARDRKNRQQASVEYSPTYEIDLAELKRKQKRELRKLQKRVKNLENDLTGGGGGAYRR